jgi:hypothetical protein
MVKTSIDQRYIQEDNQFAQEEVAYVGPIIDKRKEFVILRWTILNGTD